MYAYSISSAWRRRSGMVVFEKEWQKGWGIGEKKGKAEELRHMATQLKKRGVAPEIIAQCAGLSMGDSTVFV